MKISSLRRLVVAAKNDDLDRVILDADEPDEPASADTGDAAAPDASDDIAESPLDDEDEPDDANASDDDSGGASEDEDLPEWEPLTPELVEDEALRGDFVLRWSVMLLAILLGCTQIVESETLMHVASGKWLAGHGIWPPATDPLSYTATERPWTNLSWGWDLLMSAVMSAAGGTGLSFFKAAMAGLAFGLLAHTQRRGIPTWWGAVCAAVALLGVYRHFTATTELVTLLGVCMLLWLINRSRQGGHQSSLWGVVPLLAVWSNLDPRAAIGAGILTLYAGGMLLDQRTGRVGDAAEPPLKTIGLTVAASWLALLLNPFGWKAWSGPWLAWNEAALWQEMYPGRTDGGLGFEGFASSAIWLNPTLPFVACVVLAVAALVMLVLNRRSASASHALLWIAVNALGLFSVREWALLAPVNCLIATINGQLWYRDNFRMEYSVETRELLFSRGGRAVTVLAFFAVAVLVITGRLEGPDGWRTGIGISQRLQSDIDGLRSVAESSFDDHPFHPVRQQGDVLLFVGQKSFIDSRLSLFAGEGEDDLTALHHQTRQALRKPRQLDLTADPDAWQPVFDRFEITHVIPRLSAPRPDYLTFGDLLEVQDTWQLTDLNAVAAVFYRADLADAKLSEYIEDHQLNASRIVAMGLREVRKDTTELPVREWPRGPGFYDRWLTPPRGDIADDVQLARHYMQLMMLTRQAPILQAALANLAIRHCDLALRRNPREGEAYRVLTSCQSMLGTLETQIMSSSGQPFVDWTRYFENVCAARSVLIIDPDAWRPWATLYETYLSTGRSDLAAEALTALLTNAPAGTLTVEDRERLTASLGELTSSIETPVTEIRTAVQSGADPFQVSVQAYQAGLCREALRILDDNPALTAGKVDALEFRAKLLLEVGEAEQASDLWRTVEQLRTGTPGGDWRHSAGLSALVQGDYGKAVALWDKNVREWEQRRIAQQLLTLPMTAAIPVFGAQGGSAWPVTHLQSSVDLLYTHPDQAAAMLLNMALASLEQGNPDAAKAALAEIIEEYPACSIRPLVRFYWFAITEEEIPLTPPSGDLQDSDGPPASAISPANVTAQ